MLMRTAVIALSLFYAGLASVALAQSSPRSVLQRFCELDAVGKQLNPEGRAEIAGRFVAPLTQNVRRIVVIKDFVVSLPNVIGRKAEFYVEYIELAEIDPVTARLSMLPSMKARSEFILRQSSDRTNSPSPQVEWRIEGQPPDPHVTIETALQYLHQIRGQTKSAAIQRRADAGLASLRRLQP